MPNSVFATPLRPALPDLRSRVMSSLPPPPDEPAALGEVGARDQRAHERGDLGRVGRAVGVEHHDDVAGGGGEPAGHRVALALAGLGDHLRPTAAPRRATSIVPSVELPSTTMISWTAGRTAAIAGSTISRFRASLRVGTITDTRGLPLRCIDVLPPTAVRRCLAHHAGTGRCPGPTPRGTADLIGHICADVMRVT